MWEKHSKFSFITLKAGILAVKDPATYFQMHRTQDPKVFQHLILWKRAGGRDNAPVLDFY